MLISHNNIMMCVSESHAITVKCCFGVWHPHVLCFLKWQVSGNSLKILNTNQDLSLKNIFLVKSLLNQSYDNNYYKNAKVIKFWTHYYISNIF